MTKGYNPVAVYNEIGTCALSFLSTEAKKEKPFQGIKQIPMRNCGKYYKGGNSWYLWSQLANFYGLSSNVENPTLFMTMKGWNTYGRNVIKGSRSCKVGFHNGYRLFYKDKSKEPRDITNISEKDKKLLSEGQANLSPTIKIHSVFPMEATEPSKMVSEETQEITDDLLHVQSDLTQQDAKLIRQSINGMGDLIDLALDMIQEDKRLQKRALLTNNERALVNRMSLDLSLAHRLGTLEEAGAFLGGYTDEAIDALNSMGVLRFGSLASMSFDIMATTTNYLLDAVNESKNKLFEQIKEAQQLRSGVLKIREQKARELIESVLPERAGELRGQSTEQSGQNNFSIDW